jgi:hypothetical protein
MTKDDLIRIEHFLQMTERRIKELEVLKKHKVISRSQTFELEMCYADVVRAKKALEGKNGNCNNNI